MSSNGPEGRIQAERVVAALASDDNFSRPLAVTVQSVVSNLSAGRDLDLYICDMGISAANRASIETIADIPDVSLHWLELPAGSTEHLPASTFARISKAAYARLFLPRILPAGTQRVLYLDSDLLVRHCIGDLFDSAMGDWVALAALDAASPFVSSPWGVPYWVRHGRRADEFNFNSGVLLMDVAKWRDEQVAEAAVDYLTGERHGGMVDQEAINAVLGRRIGELDPRWNQQAEHHNPLFQATLPYSEADLQALIKDPWIVHFTTEVKPWMFGSEHPFRDDWFAAIDATPYRGWRPSRSRHVAERVGRKVDRAGARLRKR